MICPPSFPPPLTLASLDKHTHRSCTNPSPCSVGWSDWSDWSDVFCDEDGLDELVAFLAFKMGGLELNEELNEGQTKKGEAQGIEERRRRRRGVRCAFLGETFDENNTLPVLLWEK